MLLWHAVDGVVGGHDRLGLAFDDASLKVRQPVFVEHALADGGGEALAVVSRRC